jgi:DNA repair protein RadC
MILVGKRGQYLCDEEVATGHETALASRYRFLIERALVRGARSIVLVHNHPSGDAMPSAGDLNFTRRFAGVCATLDLELSDHLIVAGRSVFSMKRAGLL